MLPVGFPLRCKQTNICKCCSKTFLCADFLAADLCVVFTSAASINMMAEWNRTHLQWWWKQRCCISWRQSAVPPLTDAKGLTTCMTALYAGLLERWKQNSAARLLKVGVKGPFKCGTTSANAGYWLCNVTNTSQGFEASSAKELENKTTVLYHNV